jgi:TolB-like protein
MAEERAQRRLAAILAADVVGYSRLMGEDEAGTLAALKTRRKDVLEPVVARNQGRIFKVAGDGALVEFGSAVNAVQCAVELQRGMATANADLPEHCRIVLRIGVNLGDVMVEGSDLYGDGVNIAARLEGMAEPGGICISAKVHDEVGRKLTLACDDLGEQQLKNIATPIRVFRVVGDSGRVSAAEGVPLSIKPSIAVLPFTNMSADPEQEYFADGIVEEIITALSQMRWLSVIARNSSFTYKGKNVDVKQVGRELGVRYVLEGSVRKSGSRVRIAGQLIDTSTGAHLWANRFEGALEDIFNLQDEVTTSVVGALAPTLEKAEIDRAKRKSTDNLDAYDHYLRGLSYAYQRTNEANSEALRLFYRAIELDPNFASAYGIAAWCYLWRKINGWMTDRVHEISEAARLARRAVELGKDDAVALARGGQALGFVIHDLDSGVVFLERALLLNPNLALAWYISGWIRAYRGELDVAIEQLARAMRLSPLDPTLYHMQAGTAFAHLLAGRFDDASSWAERAFRDQPNYTPAAAIAAASNALGGRLVEAHQAMECLRQIDPALSMSNLKDWFPIRRPEHFARWAEGLRKAGLPE